jgi:hypothetical protein
MSDNERRYRLVLYDRDHKVVDARAFEVSDESEQVYVTVGDKRFTLFMPPSEIKQESKR